MTRHDLSPREAVRAGDLDRAEDAILAALSRVRKAKARTREGEA